MNLRWKPIVPLAKAAVAVVVLTALSIRAVYPPAGVDIIAPPGISLVVPQALSTHSTTHKMSPPTPSTGHLWSV